MAWFGGSFTGYNLVPSEVTVVTEVFVCLLFFCSFLLKRGRGYQIHLFYPFVIFFLTAFCSSVANFGLNLRIIFSLRLILRFYIFYLALINLNLSDTQLIKANRMLFVCFVLQLVASAIKFKFYGVSELTMGAYAVRGGGPTTLIPIIALGFLSGFYVYHKPRKIYFFLAIGFILYGIVGAKKALFFLYPVTFLGLYLLVFVKGDKGVGFVQSIALFIAIGVVCICIASLQMKYLPELNVEKYGGGKINFNYTLNFLKRYTNAPQSGGATGATVGRTATTKLVFLELTKAGIDKWLLGFGAGSLTGSMFDEQGYKDSRIAVVQDSYGMTGMTHILIEYGILGVLCLGFVFSSFAYNCWQWYSYESDLYWKAFSVGALVFAFLDMFAFFFYSSLVVLDDIITPTYYYVMAVMFIRSQQLKKGKTMIRHNIVPK